MQCHCLRSEFFIAKELKRGKKLFSASHEIWVGLGLINLWKPRRDGMHCMGSQKIADECMPLLHEYIAW